MFGNPMIYNSPDKKRNWIPLALNWTDTTSSLSHRLPRKMSRHQLLTKKTSLNIEARLAEWILYQWFFFWGGSVLAVCRVKGKPPFISFYFLYLFCYCLLIINHFQFWLHWGWNRYLQLRRSQEPRNFSNLHFTLKIFSLSQKSERTLDFSSVLIFLSKWREKNSESTLENLASNYPNLARTGKLKYRTSQGKDLRFIVISNNVKTRDSLEPMVKLVGERSVQIVFSHSIKQSFQETCTGTRRWEGRWSSILQTIFLSTMKTVGNYSIQTIYKSNITLWLSKPWIKFLVDNTEIHLLPTLNPDGFQRTRLNKHNASRCTHAQ